MRLQVPNLAHMGRPGVVEGTRELIEYPYIIVSTMIEMRLSLYRLYTAPVIASLNERGGRNSGRGHLHSPDWLLVG